MQTKTSKKGATLTTTESVMFQMFKDAKDPKFKECQNFVKAHIQEIKKAGSGISSPL